MGGVRRYIIAPPRSLSRGTLAHPRGAGNAACCAVFQVKRCARLRVLFCARLLWRACRCACYSGFESCRGHFVGGRRVAFVLFTVGVQVEARLALIFLACRVRLRCRVCARARL